MLPVGSYLVFGAECAPTVHLLTADEHSRHQERMAIAIKRGSDRAYQLAYRVSFGQSLAQYAIPCWNHECMIGVAMDYKGPFQTEIRGIAAAIALGKPFSKDDPKPSSDDLDGGTKVPRKPAPKGKPPSALAALMQEAS